MKTTDFVGLAVSTECVKCMFSSIQGLTGTFCELQELIDTLERDLTYAIEVEGKMNLTDVSNYDQVLTRLRRRVCPALALPTRSVEPTNSRVQRLLSKALIWANPNPDPMPQLRSYSRSVKSEPRQFHPPCEG